MRRNYLKNLINFNLFFSLTFFSALAPASGPIKNASGTLELQNFSAGSAAVTFDSVLPNGVLETTITTNDAKLISNWVNFSSATNESIRFIQNAGSQSVALARVISGNPSRLLGNLTANGQVFISNPSGVLFGENATVNVHGLVATTLNISDADFMNGQMNGQYNFSGLSTNAVINNGTITAGAQGYVAFLGQGVQNNGTITANEGSVILSGASAGTLSFTPDNLVSFSIGSAAAGELRDMEGKPLRERVKNTGTIKADGGQVILSARTAGQVIRNAVNNEGIIEANSVGMKNGRIILAASKAVGQSGPAMVVNTGTLKAEGNDAGENGGEIAIVGEGVVIGGTVSANGEAKGGLVGAIGKRILQYGDVSANGKTGDGGTVGIVAERIIQTKEASLSANSEQANGGTVVSLARPQNIAALAPGVQNELNSLNIAVFENTVGQQGIVNDLQNGNDTTRFFSSGSFSASGATGNGTVDVVANEITLRDHQAPADANFIADAALDTNPVSQNGAFSITELTDPNPRENQSFASQTEVLNNGNIVAVNENDDFFADNAGAVYVFDTETGGLLSALMGSTQGDQVGSNGIRQLDQAREQCCFDGPRGLQAAFVQNDGPVVQNQATQNTERNSNFVVASSNWVNGTSAQAGAVTQVNGDTGLSGIVSTSNSLTGSSNSDRIGGQGISVLQNGNYYVRSPDWNNGQATDAGSVTFVDATQGLTGEVSALNSIVGSSSNDRVGERIEHFYNGSNFLVITSNWDNGNITDAGAVTWVDGSKGKVGEISAENSIVGTSVNDQIGRSFCGNGFCVNGIRMFENGSFLVQSPNWDAPAAQGAPFLGMPGIPGIIPVMANVGAVTFGKADGSTVGVISAANSLIGSHTNDNVGARINTIYNNGTEHYVVLSPNFDNFMAIDAGAVTLGDTTNGVTGVVNSQNSLIGSSAFDRVGSAGIEVLDNGNFVVFSPEWDMPSSAGSFISAVHDVGAVTLLNTKTGTSDVVSKSNSLTGSFALDRIGTSSSGFGFGFGQINFNRTFQHVGDDYLLISSNWTNGQAFGAGAVTWIDGETFKTSDGVNGLTGGVITANNSLVGTNTNDQLGNNGIRHLNNDNYLILSSNWNSNRGAVTWINGTSGLSKDGQTGVKGGVITKDNSLIGNFAFDGVGTSQFGGSNIRTLNNGNYVVISTEWNAGDPSQGGLRDVGAITLGDGANGTVGVVSAQNSLVGSSQEDRIGNNGIQTLDNFCCGPRPAGAGTNSNFVVRSTNWDNGNKQDVGAITWVDGTKGLVGQVSAANSLIGSNTRERLGQNGVEILSNSNYVVRNQNWNNGKGAVTWADGTKGVTGEISAVNSLVGSTDGDEVGSGLRTLSNGNFVINSENWDNGNVVDAGAVTWIDGTKGLTGEITSANSLVGTQTEDKIGSRGIQTAGDGYLVRSPEWDNETVSDAGAVTWANINSGIVGEVSSTNSLVGSSENDRVGEQVTTVFEEQLDGPIFQQDFCCFEGPRNGNFLVISSNWDNDTITDVGAVTWIDSSTGLTGAVSELNSLIGVNADDKVGSSGQGSRNGIRMFNGSYIVQTASFDGVNADDAGSLTWLASDAGYAGSVSPFNSIIGNNKGDQFGSSNVNLRQLDNGDLLLNARNANTNGLNRSGFLAVVSGGPIPGNIVNGVVAPSPVQNDTDIPRVLSTLFNLISQVSSNQSPFGNQNTAGTTAPVNFRVADTGLSVEIDGQDYYYPWELIGQFVGQAVLNLPPLWQSNIQNSIQ